MKANVQKTIRIPLNMVEPINVHKKRLKTQSDSATILDLIRIGIDTAAEQEIDSYIEKEGTPDAYIDNDTSCCTVEDDHCDVCDKEPEAKEEPRKNTFCIGEAHGADQF